MKMKASLACGALVLSACGSTNTAPLTKEQALQCASPAIKVLDKALCICEDYRDIGAGFTVTPVKGGKADVGVNGASFVIGASKVEGSFHAYGGISGVGAISVRDDLISKESVRGCGVLSVGRDLSVGGDLANVGKLKVGGALRLGGDKSLVGAEDIASTGAYAAPAAPPCDCDPATRFDVAKAVADAKVKNDNAAAGLSELGVVGKQDLTLKTGSYYFGDTLAVGLSRITIEGTVALHIDGSLDTVGAEVFRLQPGSVLDLYVSGSVRTVGALALGAQSDPGSFRLYVGGSDSIVATIGASKVNGFVYAPTAEFKLIGATKFSGGLFAKSVSGIGLLEVGYTPVTAPAPELCTGGGSPTTPGGSDDSPGDGGSGIN